MVDVYKLFKSAVSMERASMSCIIWEKLRNKRMNAAKASSKILSKRTLPY
jgi:hypothetical protein